MFFLFGVVCNFWKFFEALESLYFVPLLVLITTLYICACEEVCTLYNLWLLLLLHRQVNKFVLCATLGFELVLYLASACERSSYTKEEGNIKVGGLDLSRRVLDRDLDLDAQKVSVSTVFKS